MNRWRFFGVSLALIAAFYLLREHWGHALGLAPYVLLLACPLLHLFHRHGDGSFQHELVVWSQWLFTTMDRL